MEIVIGLILAAGAVMGVVFARRGPRGLYEESWLPARPLIEEPHRRGLDEWWRAQERLAASPR